MRGPNKHHSIAQAWAGLARRDGLFPALPRGASNKEEMAAKAILAELADGLYPLTADELENIVVTQNNVSSFHFSRALRWLISMGRLTRHHVAAHVLAYSLRR